MRWTRSVRACRHLLCTDSTAGARAVYDTAAPVYPMLRRLWLLAIGGSAQRRLHRQLVRLLAPGARVLDLGCGTGSTSERLLHDHPKVRVALADVSAAMLERVDPRLGPRVQADALRLPFTDDAFDAVVAAWSLETTADPQAALDECLRVTAPGGVVALTYCAHPASPWIQWLSAPLRRLITHRFAGHFLCPLQPSSPHRLLHHSSAPTRLADALIVGKPSTWRSR